jgi:hypothetical protein
MSKPLTVKGLRLGRNLGLLVFARGLGKAVLVLLLILSAMGICWSLSQLMMAAYVLYLLARGLG